MFLQKTVLCLLLGLMAFNNSKAQTQKHIKNRILLNKKIQSFIKAGFFIEYFITNY